MALPRGLEPPVVAVRGRTHCDHLPSAAVARATQLARVKVISGNPKHAAEEVALSEIEIFGKAL
jgi:hypothetical protein